MLMNIGSDKAVWPAVRSIGVDGLLVSFGDTLTEDANRAALAFRAALDDADLQGIAETATSLTSAYLRFDLGATDHKTLRLALTRMLDSRDWYAAPLPQGRRLWLVPAVFDGDHAPQIDETAAMIGLTRDQAIAALCASPLRVQTIGFAPGQPYLGQLPKAWDIPRQTALTPRVPEGALAVAIRQLVLFSVTTPTGWRQVGQSALRLFHPDRPEPFVLRPGDEVRFRPVNADELRNMRHRDPMGGAVAQALT